MAVGEPGRLQARRVKISRKHFQQQMEKMEQKTVMVPLQPTM